MGILEKIDEVCGPSRNPLDHGLFPRDKNWKFAVRGDEWLKEGIEEDRQEQLRRVAERRAAQAKKEIRPFRGNRRGSRKIGLTTASCQVLAENLVASLTMSSIIVAVFLARSRHGGGGVRCD